MARCRRRARPDGAGSALPDREGEARHLRRDAGQDARRPAARTEWANLFLAGDWTDTGLPATIEGALRSGNSAAAARRWPAPDRCIGTAAIDSTDLGWLEDDIGRAAQALMRRQRADGHWVFELEADATIPSEYVLLRHYLGEPDDLELERKIAAYLRRIQGEHGGWPLFHGGAFDISASVKAYFCLKMIGDSPDAPHMAKARNAILAHGGAEQANVFTRILLAQFGQLAWAHVPTMPVEIILLPRWFPDPSVADVLLGAHRHRAASRAGGAAQARAAIRAASPSRSCSPRRRRSERGWRRMQHRGWALFFNALDTRAESRRAAVAEEDAQTRRRALRRLRHRAAERRGRPWRDLSRHGELGDDVRCAGLSGGSSRLAPRPAARSTSCW